MCARRPKRSFTPLRTSGTLLDPGCWPHAPWPRVPTRGYQPECAASAHSASSPHRSRGCLPRSWSRLIDYPYCMRSAAGLGPYAPARVPAGMCAGAPRCRRDARPESSGTRSSWVDTPAAGEPTGSRNAGHRRCRRGSGAGSIWVDGHRASEREPAAPGSATRHRTGPVG